MEVGQKPICNFVPTEKDNLHLISAHVYLALKRSGSRNLAMEFEIKSLRMGQKYEDIIKLALDYVEFCLTYEVKE